MTRRRRVAAAPIAQLVPVRDAHGIDPLVAEQYVSALAQYDVAQLMLDHSRITCEAAQQKYALQRHALTGQLKQAELRLKNRRAYIEQNYNVNLDDYTIADGRLEPRQQK